MQDDSKPRWLDWTINLQTLLGSIIGAAIALAAIYYAMVGRVQALELHDVERGARFTRIESDIRQQRQDVKEQLNAIGDDVKEIRRYLMDNAAGSRPDTRRWSK